ncbi:MAG: TIR domain-containing protein [Stygiobacter sp.]|nr:MAG: TIR domain-containing protein [Stygiobacter sp.]
MEIRTKWIYYFQPNQLRGLVVDIQDSDLSYSMLDEIKSRLELFACPENTLKDKLDILVNYYISLLADKEKHLVIAGKKIFPKFILANYLSEDSVNPFDINNIQYSYEFSHYAKEDGELLLSMDKIPKHIQQIIVDIHKYVNEEMYKLFYNSFSFEDSQIKINTKKKKELFISYRSNNYEFAISLFHLLGDYNNKNIFTPRMDKIDLSSGSWIQQLIDLIIKCQVFIPILSKDYLNGPISKPELEQALRKNFTDNMKIIPVLIEGDFIDYENHFIGNYQILDARNGLDNELIDTIYHMVFALSRNPYE